MILPFFNWDIFLAWQPIKENLLYIYLVIFSSYVTSHGIERQGVDVATNNTIWTGKVLNIGTLENILPFSRKKTDFRI